MQIYADLIEPIQIVVFKFLPSFGSAFFSITLNLYKLLYLNFEMERDKAVITD